MSKARIVGFPALAAILAVVAAGCGGEDPAPSVRILEVSPEALDPARDDENDLRILVEYRDADGDLGDGVAEVHDCRAEGVVIELAIPPIASAEAVEAGVPIEGRLLLVVSNVGEVSPDPAAPEVCAALGVPAPVTNEATFCVLLVDAAGNPGEGDCTPPVALLSTGE